MNSRLISELNAHGIAVFTKTLDGIYESINRAGAEMIGASFDSVVGTDDFEHFDKASAILMQQRDAGLIESNKMVHVDSVVKNGQEWMRFHTMKMGFGEGKNRLLIGLSARLDRGGRDEKRERVLLEAARAIEQDPRALLQLIHYPQPDLVFRPQRYQF